MPKLIKPALLVISLLVIASGLQAQTKPDKAYEFRDLGVFIGIWDADATITIDTIPHKLEYHMNFRKTAGDYGINMDEAYTDSVLGGLRGANLIGFGYEDKKIHWYCVDNMGHAYERVGQWNDSENLHFTYSTTKGEKKYNEVITYKFNGTEEFTYKFIAYLDGKEVKQVKGKFKKRKPIAPVPQPKK